MLNRIVLAFRLVVALSLFAASWSAAAAGEEIYTLAILPSAPPVAMHTTWAPYADRIARDAGIKLKLKHYDKMAEFERDIWNGVPDFIFSTPVQFTVAYKANGYLPLVRARKAITVGLFVRQDSPVRSVSDLAGKKISFVGNKAICSVAMQHLLAKKNEKLSFENEYAGSTRNVIINILLGKTDAGSIFMPDMEYVPGETRAQLRELIESDEISAHPLSVHPRVPRRTQEALRRATLAMANDAEGAGLLKSLRLEDPVAADYRRDYIALEEIDVKRLSNWGQ